jgi:hypothetical protein
VIAAAYLPCGTPMSRWSCARASRRTTALEQGATCAIRASVPLVEEGSAALDPCEPFPSARVNDDVVSTCETVSDGAVGELRREILRLVAPILFGAGMLASQTVCRIEPAAARLQVSFDLPLAVSASVKQALAVRVVDAVGGPGAPTGPSRSRSAIDRATDATPIPASDVASARVSEERGRAGRGP